MIKYRVKQVEVNKFIVTEQKAPGKHFKQPYYNRGEFYSTEEEAQKHINTMLKLDAMTNDELFAACGWKD